MFCDRFFIILSSKQYLSNGTSQEKQPQYAQYQYT